MAKKELIRLEGELMNLHAEQRSVFAERGEDIEGSQKKMESFIFARLHSDFVSSHGHKLQELEGSIRLAEEEVERQRRWLTHVGQELKIIEKLEEKQRLAFEDQQRLIEKRRVDQWVAERWKREAE